MEKELKELSAKIDKLIEVQELILSRLNQSTILTKEPITSLKKSTKKEEQNKRMEEFSLIIRNRHWIQVKFNLAVAPQSNRILAYLRTNDASVFDGLKRNK